MAQAAEFSDPARYMDFNFYTDEPADLLVSGFAGDSRVYI